MRQYYYISVPKDKVAQEALEFNRATDEQLLEMKLNEEKFRLLDKADIFYLINDECNTVIDEYEEDSITELELLDKCIKLLDNFKADGELKELIDKLIELVKEARSRKTGIFFYF